jgi:hypothetical protein
MESNPVAPETLRRLKDALIEVSDNLRDIAIQHGCTPEVANEYAYRCIMGFMDGAIKNIPSSTT